MSEQLSSSQKKMIENEAVFRKYNEQVQKNFDQIKESAREDGQEYLVKEPETPLHFYCECSDENCRERIEMPLREHTRLHKNRKVFMVLPGHEVNKIERVVEQRPHYTIVEKYVKAPESPGSLNATPVNNVPVSN